MVVVAEDDLRLLGPDDRDQATENLLEGSIHEGERMPVLFHVRHSGVAIAEHDDVFVADDRRSVAQFGSTNRREIGPGLWAIGCGIENVACLTAGCGDQDRTDTLVAVSGDGSRAFARLIIRVRMQRNNRSGHQSSQTHAGGL